MPDLNELLRWSIANSARSTDDTASDAAPADQQLSLRFNPVSTHSGTSALHASDSAPIDYSPASTPGPATPQGGATLPLPSGGDGSASGAVPGRRSDLTSEMLDLIMGKSDSIIMKEKMEAASDESQSVEDRVVALDDFEMLIELIDNANNMPILKLWDPLLSLLSSPHPEIAAHAAWIIGTAVQNNLKAQAALYINNTLPHLFSLLYPTPPAPPQPSSVRAKATYALSSALKHWPLASSALASPISSSSANSNINYTPDPSSSGYSYLQRAVTDSDPIIRRKASFLINQLSTQSGEAYEGELPNEVINMLEARMKEVEASGSKSESLVEGLSREGVYTALVEGLSGAPSDSDDVEYQENCVRALARGAEKGGLSAQEKEKVRLVWDKWGASGQEERGLGGEDGKDIASALR